MNWLGLWRNQYGSTVRITSIADDRVQGTFATALTDSGFAGVEASIVGLVRGRCISFAACCTADGNDMIVSYTGLLRDDRMETMWLYVADGSGDAGEETPWWRAVITNADTFERVDEG